MDNVDTPKYLLFVSLLLISAFCDSCAHDNNMATPPDPEKYRAIRDAKDWQNPYLIIRRDGVITICNAISKNERKLISVDELASHLAGLPKGAWPYGGIVGLQENGLRSGNGTELISANKAKVQQILKSLRVESNWWP